MTKKFLRITSVWAACSMLAASAWAQAQSQDQPSSDTSASRSWSTKHLSATGRDNDKTVRASKLTGAQVNDSSGQRVGTIQDVTINASSGRVDFALLELNSSSTSESSMNSSSTSTSTSQTSVNRTSSGKLVPVPWSLLRTSTSSQYSTSSEQPTFTLQNIDQNKLNAAPTVDASELSQSQWQQRIYSYYGVTPQSMGGAESPQGEIKGEGARRMENTTPDRQQPPVP